MRAPLDSLARQRRAACLAKAGPIVLVAAIFFGGVYGFGATLIESGQDIRYGLASRDWPGKVGIVESSVVEKGGRGSRTPRIGYRYEANGRTMRSERIGTRSAYENAYELVAAYPAGAEVLVYHDPTGEPAVLERGIGTRDVVRFAVLLLASGVGLVFYCVLLCELVKMPAIEHLAQWRVVRRTGYRRAGNKPKECERQVRADAAMEAEIVERLREYAARRDRQ